METSNPQPYLERDVESRLLAIVRDWLGGNHPHRWVSLRSRPGNGNTYLLDHVQRRLETDGAFSDVRAIRVSCESVRPDRPPPALNPLADSLYQLVSDHGAPVWRRVRRRIANAGPGRRFLVVLMLIAFTALASLAAGLHEYNTEVKGDLASKASRFQEFWTTYLPQNWQNFPLWLGSGALVGLPFSLLALFLARNGLLPKPAADSPSSRDLVRLASLEGISEHLDLAADGASGLVVLIDDAWLLPVSEQNLLDQLVGTGARGPLLAPSGKALRLLWVTLEYDDLAWSSSLTSSHGLAVEELSIPPFTPLQLELIREAYTAGRPAPAQADEDPVAESGGNVKELLRSLQPSGWPRIVVAYKEARTQDIDRAFGFRRLLAYQALRGQPTIEKSEVFLWLQQLSSGDHLSAFGISPPEQPQALAKELFKTSLLRTSGEHCYVDLEQASALRQHLEESDPDLAYEVHLYWARSSLSHLSAAETSGPASASQQTAVRHVVKRGAWHAAQLGRVQGDPLTSLGKAVGLGPEQRAEWALEIARLLTGAAALWREEGNLTESDDLLVDATDWLGDFGDDRQRARLEGVVDELWQNYWLGGRPSSRGHAERLASAAPAILSRPACQAHQAYQALLRGARPGSEELAPDPALGPRFESFRLLVEALQQVRRRTGFQAAALADEQITFPQPSTSELLASQDCELLFLAGLAASHRDQEEEALGIAERLLAGLPALGDLHGQPGAMVVAYIGHGIGWELLTHLLDRGSEESPLREAGGLRSRWPGLAEALSAGRPLESDASLAADGHAFEQAERFFRHALAGAALLGWSPLVWQVSFRLARLKLRFTPHAQRTEAPPWWETWEELFKLCLGIEQQLEWRYHQPEIHGLRLEFFSDLDRQASVEDAFNLSQAVREAGYPLPVVLDRNRKAAAYLNDYGDSDLDRQRSAELHEVWARELCLLPEAESLRQYPPHLEQADSLNFAAQAYRHLKKFAKAHACLDEAAVILAQGKEGQGEEDAGGNQEAMLRTGIKLQRAWVFEEQDAQQAYRQLICELWTEVQRADRFCVLVLDSIVTLERSDSLLEGAWPPPGCELMSDPDNPAMSLPEEWAGARLEALLKQRFDFRFLQLLSLLPVPEVPQARDLLFLASLDWTGRGSEFASAGLRLARLGGRLPLELEIKRLMIAFLESLRLYFRQVHEVDQDELQTLRLLMYYTGDSDAHRFDYVRVLYESENLIEREVGLRTGLAIDWLAMAQKVEELLGFLVEPAAALRLHDLAFQPLGVSLEDLAKTRSARAVTLTDAQSLFERADFANAVQAVEKVLPTAEGCRWVFLDDLRLLDLWLRGARALGTVVAEEIVRRATDLRTLTLRFVRQFSSLFPEEQLQHVTLRLAHAIEEAASAGARPLPF